VTLLGALGIFALGTIASVFGSLVGLGGGFVVIPVLRIFFGIPAAEAAGTSLVMVLANTGAASVRYLRHGTADMRLAIPIAIGAVPGSVLGVIAVKHFSNLVFDVAYGVVLVMNSALVLRRRAAVPRPIGERTFAHDWRVGLVAGVGVGFFSSLFGIGGGVVMIPLLLIAARMAPHVVTATSSLVITVTSPVGVLAHALAGDVDWALALPLVLGGLVGGTIGPSIARRVSSPRLTTLLAIALMLAAVSFALRHFIRT
jgi:hypothetical protein